MSHSNAAGANTAAAEHRWDHHADVVVIGTGAAGLGAALTAAACGLKPLVLEASKMIGGSTAMSGGGIWAPNNRFMRSAGIADSRDDALRYLAAVVGEVGRATSPERKRAYVDTINEAIAFFEDNDINFRPTTGYPDYHPDEPGSSVQGRCIEPIVFDRNKAGEWRTRFPKRLFPRTMPMGNLDAADMFQITRSISGFATFVRVLMHHLYGKVTGQRLVACGASLVSQFLCQLSKRRVPIWIETSAFELCMAEGRVVGVVARRNGAVIRINARVGVHLGGGGFARNAEMRNQYQPKPVTGTWSSASVSDQGSAIQLGTSLGADTELMDEAWWGPASIMPNGIAIFNAFERAKPGSIMVDQSGVRYMNEAQSYVDAGHIMLERNRTVPAVPSWFIFDQRFRSRYPFGTLYPHFTPQELVDKNYMRRAPTLSALADMCKIDGPQLIRTVERFNSMADGGVDEDFNRGGNAFDRYFGDPTVRPSPTLGALRKAPFYAVEMYPGDLGTKGGLVTDENGRVLSKNGVPIDGLYASGNTTASVMGRRYPGPGVTLGPALTFAYRAMRFAAAEAGIRL
jgi:3-oxosteroid 1-dehydrogenase